MAVNVPGVIADLNSWWDKLDPVDLRIVHSLGSSEHWFQFDYALRAGRAHREGRGPVVSVETGGRKDVLVGETPIQFKQVWNNKNLPAQVEGVIYDAERLAPEGGGVLAVVWSFFNRAVKANELEASFGLRSGDFPLQPAGASPFQEFARQLSEQFAAAVAARVEIRCTEPRVRVCENDAWIAAAFWPVPRSPAKKQ